MSAISRLLNWFKPESSYVDDQLQGKVIVPKSHWDGFPSNADECRRSYKFGEGVALLTFANVKCPCCGDSILRHDYEGGEWNVGW